MTGPAGAVAQPPSQTPALRAFESCAGAGGQALGLERAGFANEALVGIGPYACATGKGQEMANERL